MTAISKDDRVLNDIYPTDQLPNFILGARPPEPHRATAALGKEQEEQKEHDMDTNEPTIPKVPSIWKDVVQ